MRPLRLSLRNKLALTFAAIMIVAIGGMYLYVAPGLQSRLIKDKLGQLAQAARRDSSQIVATVGSSEPAGSVSADVSRAGAASGNRVTLLLVSEAVAPGGPQLSVQADSEALNHSESFPLAYRAVATHRLVTGTTGGQAQAALPVTFAGLVARVIVYSAPLSDIVRTVSTVRHEILLAGGIALLLALLLGYGVAGALAQRVKRLERAAEQIAAGDFAHPIRVTSSDELAQLAVAFNDMQRQLSQLEDARKKFIATASHELRTPIFSLGGFIELLQDEELDDETRRRFLDQLSQQVQRLRKLSVDLLDLSRLEAGSLELRPEQVDLCELTRSVAGEFEPTLVQHDAHLELRLAHRRLEAQCDPVRVAQIMRILIDNALTHTSAGTRIVVTAGRDDGHVRVAVRDDDGQGIERQALARIFEPFFTADGAQGSGLGLAIASELAERMAGRLWVQSEPGETVFTLEIPA